MNHSFIRGANRKKGSGRAEALLLIPRSTSGGFYGHGEKRRRRPATLSLCLRTQPHRSSLGVPRDSPHALSCVCVDQARFMSTNTAPLSGGVRFRARLYGSKLLADGRAEHFNGTHLPLTPFNLLTCINRL